MPSAGGPALLNKVIFRQFKQRVLREMSETGCRYGTSAVYTCEGQVDSSI